MGFLKINAEKENENDGNVLPSSSLSARAPSQLELLKQYICQYAGTPQNTSLERP